ncbi:hypothetical protein ABPG74_009888 [Tetrahymena malaccensis]
MSLNPWAGRPFKAVFGFFFICYCMSLPLQFIYIYKKALEGNIFMIIISLLQIYFQYFAKVKVSPTLVKFTKWMHYEKYFEEFNFHQVEEHLQEKDSIFAVHPHYMFTYGLVLNYYQGNFGKNLAVLTTRSLLMLPGYGLLHQLTGLQGVDADNMKKLMKNHQNFALVPGGFEEATLTTRNEQKIFVKNRKGFIKYAIQGGYTIYPVYIFGESKAYYYIESFLNLRLALNKIKMVGVFFWSRFGFIIPEWKVKINTVVGKGLKFPQSDNPSKEQIDKCHAEYIEALKNLYYSHREKFGETADLAIY